MIFSKCPQLEPSVTLKGLLSSALSALAASPPQPPSVIYIFFFINLAKDQTRNTQPGACIICSGPIFLLLDRSIGESTTVFTYKTARGTVFKGVYSSSGLYRVASLPAHSEARSRDRCAVAGQNTPSYFTPDFCQIMRFVSETVIANFLSFFFCSP